MIYPLQFCIQLLETWGVSVQTVTVIRYYQKGILNSYNWTDENISNVNGDLVKTT